MTTLENTRRCGALAALLWLCLSGQAGCLEGPDQNTPSQPGDLLGTLPPESCSADVEFFREELWEPVLRPHCSDCHRVNGLAHSSRLHFAEGPDALGHNFATLWAVARLTDNNLPLLLQKPTDRAAEPHTGGQLFAVESPAYNALLFFTDRATGKRDCQGQWVHNSTEAPPSHRGDSPSPQAGPRLLRRLSHRELFETINALFPNHPPDLPDLAADEVVEGYANNARALVVSPLLAQQYGALAETIAARLVPEFLSSTECDPLSDGTAACAHSALASLGPRIFRRPLTPAEVERYFELWYTIALEDGYEQGLLWMVTGMLQSPHFLYRAELGLHQGDGVYALTPSEVASELSYTLTGGPPDEQLLSDAHSGAVLAPPTLHAHRERLLATPAARSHFATFIGDWFRVNQLPSVVRSEETYPEFTPEIRAAMGEQLRRTTEGAFAGDHPFAELLTGRATWLNPPLAAYYGVPFEATSPNSAAFEPVDLPASYAGGLLAAGAVLTTHARPTGSSPIHRGVLVRERLLCEDLPPPPENLDTSPPETDLTLSTRERYAEHSQNPACRGCHQRIDPIGFGFEHFDGTGRRREEDDGHPIDATGDVKGAGDAAGPFEGLGELAERLAHSAQAKRCFIRQWTTSLWGLPEEPSLHSSLESLATGFIESDSRLQPVLEGMISLPHFLTRRGDPSLPVESHLPAPSPPTLASLLGGRPAPRVGDPQTPAPLLITVQEDSRWETGACKSVAVQNQSPAPLEWEAPLTPGGEVVNLWGARVLEEEGTTLIFGGVEWNRTLEAGGSTEFGFCVNF